MGKNIYKKSTGSKIFDFINITVLIIFSCVMLYPLLYVFSVSISSPHAVTLGQVYLFPVGFDLTAYKITMGSLSLWIAYKNTIIYVVLGTLLILILNTLAAYPLSRKNFYGRKVIMIYFSITMFFNGGLIPTYLLIRKIDMINTIWVMILPWAVTAWNIIIFRTNFQNIPDELVESVKIDGGNSFHIYTNIVLPLSKPIIATIALFSVVDIWNDFFRGLVYINDNDLLPLQNYLRSLVVNANYEDVTNTNDFMEASAMGVNTSGLVEAIKMAAIIVSLGPILMAYPFVQKYFVKGALVGSIKG